MDLIDKDQTAENDYTFSSPILDVSVVNNVNLRLDSKTVGQDKINVESSLFGITKSTDRLYNQSKPNPIKKVAPEVPESLSLDESTRVSRSCKRSLNNIYLPPSYVTGQVDDVVMNEDRCGVWTRNQIRDTYTQCVNH